MSRRWSYKQEPGFFAFCAPEGFRHQDQAVDIIDIYHKYNNPDKRYIFTLRDTVDKFALTQGDSVVHGYELDGVNHVDNYNVVSTSIVGTLTAGNYTEIPVISTVGFPESGTIFFNNNLAGHDWIQFAYTSKTDTSFAGTSQSITYTFANGANICLSIDTNGINNYVIVNSSTLVDAVIYDAWFNKGGIITVGTACEWLYCGKRIDHIACGNAGLGYGSMKYIHLENNSQLRRLEYTDYYGVPLTGVLTIPDSITEIGNIYPDFNGWVGLDAGSYTKITIGKNVTLIVDGFHKRGILTRFDCYPLIAPSMPESYRVTFIQGGAIPLHIKPNATGYDVAPWNDRTIFSHIIRDL